MGEGDRPFPEAVELGRLAAQGQLSAGELARSHHRSLVELSASPEILPRAGEFQAQCWQAWADYKPPLQCRKDCQTIVDSSDFCIWAVDACDRYLVFNRAHRDRVRSLFGSEPELDSNVLDTYPPEYRSRLREMLARALSGEAGRIELEIDLEGGSSQWLELAYSPIRDRGEIGGTLVIAQEISDRIATEQALRESEARFRTVADSAPMMVWMSDETGQANFFNQVWLDYTGRRFEQEAGMGWLEGVHPDDALECRETCEAAFTDRQPFEMEYRLRSANGDYRWFLARGIPRFTPNGSFAGFIGSCIDFSDRKLAASELQNAHRQLRLLFDNSPLGIIEWDRDFRVCRWSKQAETIFGWSQAEVAGRTPGEWLIPLNDWPVVEERLEALTNGTQTANMGPNRNFTKDGRTLDCEWHNAAIADESGQIASILSIVQDTSERQFTQEALRLSEEKFRQLAEHIRDVLWIFSPQERQFLYVSPAYEKIWGRDCQSAYDDPESVVRATYEEDRDRAAAVFRPTASGKKVDVEYRIECGDGQMRWIHNRAFPLFDRFGRIYRLVGIAEDITERKHAILELQALNAELEQRVERRTAELQELNEHLHRYSVELAEWRNRYEAAGHASGQILYDWDAAEDRLKWDANTKGILGYDFAEMPQTRADFWQIVHPEDRDRAAFSFEQVLAVKEPLQIEYRLRHQAGYYIFVEEKAQFVQTIDGRCGRLVGLMMDISDRRVAEEQLRASLAEKEVLLREIHHRVKNNLNVIHSLLDMQARRADDPTLKTLLADSQKRLQTMALIHEKLYRSESLARIDFAEYLHSLVNGLLASSNPNPHLVRVELTAEPVDVNIETAIPCGLIVNELLTNAFKHAFRDRRSGQIWVEFYPENETKLHLTVRDNGVGLPTETKASRPSSLGMRLVNILADQLDATLAIATNENNEGTRFDLTF